MTPTDMYEGYASGILVANPQKRREKVAAMQIEELEQEVEQLKARILELETELAECRGDVNPHLVTPQDIDPTDTDDTNDYSDNAPEDMDPIDADEHSN